MRITSRKAQKGINIMLRIAILTACGRSSFPGRSAGAYSRKVAAINPTLLPGKELSRSARLRMHAEH